MSARDRRLKPSSTAWCTVLLALLLGVSFVLVDLSAAENAPPASPHGDADYDNPEARAARERNVGHGRKTVPGTGRGGYRVPDFDPARTIEKYGAVMESKDVSRLSSTQQLRDLEAYAQSQGVPLVIFSDAHAPRTGQLARSIRRGDVIVRPIPGR